jgi:choline dehydrogenase-like flavoprotein
MGRTEWLSEGVEKLAFELLEHGERNEPHCDIAVVGSGYGGAVAAARFAGATAKGRGEPLKVWLLERGREFVPGAFPERLGDLPGQVRVNWQRRTRGRREALFDLRIGEDVSALLGNGLGGGSLINAGVLARPASEVFRRAPWPQQFAGEALEPYFAKVETMLGAQPLPGRAPAKLVALNRLAANIRGGRAERAKIAVTFEKGKNAAGVEQEACIHCGDCFSGCNHWAKNTLAMNYLPLARARGARLFTGVTALSVSPAGEHWALELEFTDPQLRRRFGTELPRLRARRVILAAGAYGSTAILLRSKERGFDRLSKNRLGGHFSTNGDMIAAGYRMPASVHASAPESVPPRDRDIGPTITGMIDLRSREQPFVIEELAIPAALRRAFEEVVTTFGLLHDLGRIDRSEHRPGPGRDPAAIDPLAMEHTAVYATIGDDGANGLIRPERGEDGPAPDEADRPLDDTVHVEWKDVAKLPVFTEAMRALERAHGEGATVIPNPMWRLLPTAMGEVLEGGEIGGAVLTVHPLGGCPMAERAEEGVVNHLGQVFAGGHGEAVHPGLVVLDGAIVPTALGTNPCLTIAALSERAVQELARQWQVTLADGRPEALADPAARPLPPPRREAPHPASRPTALRLAERLVGRLNIDGRVLGARLDIEYQGIPDLEAFLSGASKVLPFGAWLRLTDAQPGIGGREFAFWVVGTLTFFERDATTAWGRIRKAGRAWYLNRGRREICAWIRSLPKYLNPANWKGGPGVLSRVMGWIALASHAGERRLMRYQMELGEVAAERASSREASTLLQPGDRLLGTKTIAYIAEGGPDGPWPSPWDQLTKLPVELRRKDAEKGQSIGWLEVDLAYFVQQHAAQLQIAAQENQPRALADLYSLFAYMARVVGKIHIWGLRAPDYPDPYPIYEFDRVEREKAERAAAETQTPSGSRRTTEDRLEHRLPQDMDGFRREVVPLEPQSDPQNPKAAYLTHYSLESSPPEKRGPVVLIHGLGAGGNTFTLPTIEQNLVQHLAARGFDPWVLDLRTSIGLPSSKTDWNFDAVACGDIPRAISAVRARTGDQPVNVVAHCIGAAMFCMAALKGELAPGWVRAAVLSQVGPLLELPPTNRFRGYVASYLKHYLDVEELDTASALTPLNRFLDRLLALQPYPWQEWKEHHQGTEPLTHEAYCLRSYGIYGRLFEHRNLHRDTLERLGDYLGHVRYRTYQQTIFYATLRRLTDEQGRNEYVTYERIFDNLRFPICFLHGKANEVFDKRTSERSFDLLASIFWSKDLQQLWDENPEVRYDYSLYERGKSLRIVEIEGYGHQDCMIGQHAHKDVYPAISAFLEQCEPAAVADPTPLVVVRPPRVGPILGWLREADHGGGFVARILFVPNDSRSDAGHAMSIVLQDGKPLTGFARFHELPGGRSRQTQALDVQLPREPADYCVVVVTVHSEQYEPEPSKDVHQGREDDPFGEDLDRIPTPPMRLPEAGDDADEYAERVLRTCKDLGIEGEPLPAGRRVSHKRYATPVSAAIVSREALEAARQREPASVSIRFALASCRYAANFADREAADASFGRLRHRLEPAREGRPQLLFLAGDAIYADATNGVFDPTAPRDRFELRYLEAWTAPNAREVLRRLPVYPMLDDHEVEDNFEGRPGWAKEGLRAFESYQLRLTPAFARAGGARADDDYWYIARAGGFEFFVADTRTRRRRGKARHSLNARIMDPRQMKRLRSWLKEAHPQDPDMPKFVVSPSVVAPWARETRGCSAYALRSDAWDGFPCSLHRLLAFIARERIRNVVFLSGDYHCSLFCCLRLAWDGGEPVSAYSIVSSGLYAPFPFANTRFEDLELDFGGSYKAWLDLRRAKLRVEYSSQPIGGGDSFAVVQVEGGGADRRLVVDFDSEQSCTRCVAPLAGARPTPP